MALIQRQDQTGERLKIAIAGFGSEGLSAYRYYSPKSVDITIYDENTQPTEKLPKGVKFVTGKGCFNDLTGFDVVVRFPGIHPSRIKTDGEMTSMAIEFFKACPAPIIGVTGTKGKGTTSSLITKMLETAGQTVHLVGNIGVPALDELPKIKSDDVVVFELSSFQLWDMKQSPQVAVVLMVEPEHLDIHTDLEDYLQAKSNIARWQGENDAVIYHPSNKLSAKVARVGLGKKIRYLHPEGADISGDYLTIDGHRICSVKDFGLPGEHNYENIAAAVTASWHFSQNAMAFKQAITSFRGLPHRLQLVKEIDSTKYYDDSFAANPASTRVAVHTFKEPLVLIAGGYRREGSRLSEIAKAATQKHVKHTILMGETAEELGSLIKKRGSSHYTVIKGKMDEAVELSRRFAKPGDVVLLSPGCPSFDQYINFEERGIAFQKALGAQNG